MADEELNLELEGENQEITRTNNRIKSLSEKVKTTSEERDNLAKEKAEAETRADAAQKDADFYKGFSTVSSKYEGAGEYQDKIREKVALGLDIEEATMLIMAKEGKYTPPVQETQPLVRETQAGGSASIGIHDNVEKKPSEKSRDELRNALLDIESRGEKLI